MAVDRSLILIADVPETSDLIKRVLSPLHDLVIVHNLTAAERLIENVDFDAIVASVHFDDSRMIDLLRAVRANARYTGKPFIAVRTMPTSLTANVESNSKQMATVLGASAYITVDDLGPDENQVEALRSRIIGHLSTKNGKSE